VPNINNLCLFAASPVDLDVAGKVPSALPTSGEPLPGSAPEMLRSFAMHGGRYTEAADLAAALGKESTGGQWNSGLALLRKNGLVEVSGKRLRVTLLIGG